MKASNESFKANARSNRKWNCLKRRSRLCEQDEVKWSTMRNQCRSKSEGEDVGTVTGKGRTVEKKKSEVKFRAAGKIEAPRRFWPPNRRGVYPNFNFFSQFSPIPRRFWSLN